MVKNQDSALRIWGKPNMILCVMAPCRLHWQSKDQTTAAAGPGKKVALLGIHGERHYPLARVRLENVVAGAGLIYA